MAHLTKEHLRRILDAAPAGTKIPPVFIETGTFEAQTTLIAAARFAVVHTIELLATLAAEAIEKCRGRHISVHCGDSAQWLPRLLECYDFPVVCYLDAHAFWRGAGDRERLVGLAALQPTIEVFPLWAELAALSGREHVDVVIVDDVHAFGRPAEYSPLGTPEPSWEEVNTTSILAALPGRRSEVIGDQFVIWR